MCKFYILLFFLSFLDVHVVFFSSGRVLHLQATPSPKSACAKDRTPSKRSQRIKFPLSTYFLVFNFLFRFFLKFWQVPKRVTGKQPDQSHQAADAEVETPPSGEPKKAPVKKNPHASKDAKKDAKKAEKENKASKKKALECEEPPCKKSKNASSPKPRPKAKHVDEECDKKPAGKSKAKAAKSKVKKTIRKGGKSKSQKLKTAWEEDMLQEIHEEEETTGVEDADEPNKYQEECEEEQPMEDQEECEEEQPMEDQENEENEQPDAVAPAVAETQIEHETQEVKKEAASEPADSQVSLATLLKGNEQMLAQSIANIFESQSQTESQLFAGLLG